MITLYITPQQYIPGTVRDIAIQKRKRGNPKSKNKCYYKDTICTFDIETSRLPDIEQSIMYVWQFHIHKVKCTIVGRTWAELDQLLKQIVSELDEDQRLMIFVHNLSYEFQFMRAIYDFETEEVFAIDSRKVLKCSMYRNALEFRCSYLHSNMSLEEYTNKFDVEHKKLSGEDFNYNIIRYPWTPLSDQELLYTLHDVWGLAEAIEKEMSVDEDNLYSFPLTSTGYVRRDVKAAMRCCKQWAVVPQLPDLEIYKLCREAFRGGDTHANRFYVGHVLENVKSADRSSSYPDVICNADFPVSPFVESDDKTYSEVLRLMYDRKKALLLRISVTNIRLRDPLWGFPYISKDKCKRVEGAVIDNGRVIEARYIETTLTDIDFRILLDQYDFDDIVFNTVFYARYGKLPDAMCDVVREYYRRKTALKDVDGQEVYYMKSKNKLNACYGMTAQDPVKQDIIFSNGDWSEANNPVDELLTASNERAFLCYQWGVWVTAHARFQLQEMIKLAGHFAVYVDTDSVKYLGEVDFSAYNAARIADSKKSGAFADDRKGNRHYMGVAESDGFYATFKTLGAKKYVYTKTLGGKCHVTIAGVNKKKGGAELDSRGGIEAFEPGFIFYDAGGTESIYNDHPENGVIYRDGQPLEITPNVVIKDSTYKVGITGEYERLLDFVAKSIDFPHIL